MKRFATHTTIALVLGLGLMLVLLLGLSAELGGLPTVHAEPVATTRYVALTGTDTGNDCTASGSPCRTVQHAIDQPGDGDEIRVAGGIYTGVSTRGGETQHVYITETVAIRGGYSADFTIWDPDAHPTILDAQGAGRVLFVRGPAISLTLETLRLTGGWSGENGGSVHVYKTFSVISGCQVYSNTTAEEGGGVYLLESDGATLTGNRIYDNHALNAAGGGIFVDFSDDAILIDNTVYGNTCDDAGGGIFINASDRVRLEGGDIWGNTAYRDGGIHVAHSYTTTLRGNRVHDNEATNATGGVRFSSCSDIHVIDNEIFNNTASSSGGGVTIYDSDHATLAGNQVYSNTAEMNGGGVWIYLNSSHVTLSGNAVYSNTARSTGGGIYVDAAPHVTLADNSIHHNRGKTGVGGGISLVSSRPVTLTNNIVAENEASSQGPGVYVYDSHVRMLHTTVARNSGGNGQGIYVFKTASGSAVVTLTNTILVSQTVGVQTVNGATAVLTATLWGSGAWANGSDTAGSNISTGTLNWWEAPAFADPDGGDYHIGADSPARDRGVDAGVLDDIDGDSRFHSLPPDLGADEYPVCRVRVGDTPYPTIQMAVDAASEGDVVQIAGTCRGVQTHASSNQMAYVSKTLTLRGGYSIGFSAWDPQAYPTTLDAQGGGRVIYISGQGIVGGITPTIEALRLTNGWRSPGSGGGINAAWSHPIIQNCHIYSNTAQFGGGGIYLTDGDHARLTGNQIYNNAAGWYGGGVYINFTSDDALLINNMIADNHLTGSNDGAGVYLTGASGTRFLHTTLARNRGGNGQGIYLSNGSTVWLTNTILVSHTVGIQTSGSTAYLGATLWGDGPWANGTDTVGSNISTGALNWWGDPAFVDPNSGDYHLGAGSAAFERGVSTGVPDDIDGDLRSVGLGMQPDLGADEALPTLAVTKTGPAWYTPGSTITYTLSIANTGVVTAHAVTLSDTIPSGATFLWASDSGNVKPGSDAVTWLIYTVGPEGGVVTRTFAVTATGDIVNDDYLVRSYGTPDVLGTVPVATQLNHAPVADAGPPQSVAPGTLVTLYGSGSSDPDDDPLAYSWAQTGGTSVALSSSTAVSPTFTAPSTPGETLTFSLTVTDTFGVAHSDVTTVTVKHFVYLPLVVREY
jgi:uncharacterized repeat protein (TIGR01451 family)